MDTDVVDDQCGHVLFCDQCDKVVCQDCGLAFCEPCWMQLCENCKGNHVCDPKDNRLLH